MRKPSSQKTRKAPPDEQQQDKSKEKNNPRLHTYTHSNKL